MPTSTKNKTPEPRWIATRASTSIAGVAARSCRRFGVLWFSEVEEKIAVAVIDANTASNGLRGIVISGAFEELERERILQPLLDYALERSRAEFRLISELGDTVERRGRKREDNILLFEELAEFFRLNLDDASDLALLQRLAGSSRPLRPFPSPILR